MPLPTFLVLVLLAWFALNALLVAGMVRRGNNPHVIRRREIRRLETLWSLS